MAIAHYIIMPTNTMFHVDPTHADNQRHMNAADASGGRGKIRIDARRVGREAEIAVMARRIIALRDRLCRTDISLQEHGEIEELISKCRVRLALSLGGERKNPVVDPSPCLPIREGDECRS